MNRSLGSTVAPALPRFMLALVVGCSLAADGGRAAEPAVELAAMAIKEAGFDQGLCLALGDNDGQLAAALAQAGRMYVQGCTWDSAAVQAGRERLLAAGLAERASSIWIEDKGLPYVDNLVNLMVASDWGIEGLTVAEVLRVLAPGGLALLGSDANPGLAAGIEAQAKAAGARDVRPSARRGWVRFGKALNPGYDVWSHNLGGADLSYVNNDQVVAPWSEIRWVGDPRWGSLYIVYSGRVTAGGRLYYKEARALAEGKTMIWLVARDAWNGCELWRLPVGPPPKYGNVDNTLCCDETRVFAIEQNKTLTARDGRSGEKLREYDPGFLPTVCTALGDVLLTCDLRLGTPVATRVVALDKASGKVLWTHPGIVHPAAQDGTAFVLMAGGELEAVDVVSGASRWKVKTESGTGNPRLFCKGEVVYVVHKPPYKATSLIVAHNSRSGALLWKKESQDGGHGTLPYADGLWLLDRVTGNNPDNITVKVYDPLTGAVQREGVPKGKAGAHCFPSKGTGNYLLYSSSWYLDRAMASSSTARGVRSPCSLGAMPANGMTYYFPHHCDCGITLRGLLALSSPGERKWPAGDGLEGAPRLFTTAAAPAAPADDQADWPMFRRDTARSNFLPSALPAQIKPLWHEKVGGSRLTQAVSASGVICVTEPQTRQVHARDAATGKARWSFTADGRTEWPATLYRGLCLFSTGAGSVYALDARTGREIWRLRAAPAEKYLAEEGQFASAWPVVGGVMPMQGEIFFTCGRSAGSDGGMWMFAADAATGKVRWRTPGGSSGDMFLSNGQDLMLTKIHYNPANGTRLGGNIKSVGLLHTTAYLTYVSVLDYMACVEPHLTNNRHIELTDGRITGEALAFSDKLGVAAWRHRFGVPKELMKKDRANKRFIYAKADGKLKWMLDEEIDQQMMGVVLAGETAYLAGVPTSRDPGEKGELWVLDGNDGRRVQTLTLDAYPVYDGLSAAGGRLFMVTEDGGIICFGAQ